jgi:hypothetical protein
MRLAISAVLLACALSGCVIAPYGPRPYGPVAYEAPAVVVQPSIYVAPRPYYGYGWRGRWR